ncbi:MAG: LPP20 family lipoprotein [Bacteroidales bacterium]
MKVRYLLPIFISILLLSSCGGSKKAQTPATPEPEWVKSRPSSQVYYYGIGAANKTSNISQYQQAARQNALADLAGEISINISSNSVIHAFESNLNFSEDLTSTIRSQTEQDLEGYEIVDTWEGVDNYWVYYRLSKAKYQELVEQRKQNAVSQSLNLFSDGINARDNNNIRLSVVQLIKALEPIKSYFAEPLPVDFRGEEIFLGNSIFKELSETIASLEIVPVNPLVKVKTGGSISSKLLKYQVNYGEVQGISEIPIAVSYSERPIRNNNKRTNSKGVVAFDIDVVRSSRSFENLTATIDLTDILNEATKDPTIRRLITRFNLPQGNIRINIEKPVIVVISNEVNLGEPVGYLTESFRNKAIESGYLIKNDKKAADYIIRITAATSKSGETGQFKNVALEGYISLETNEGNQLYHKPLEGFTGRHFEHDEAGKEAFANAKRRLEITYFREIHEAINKR